LVELIRDKVMDLDDVSAQYTGSLSQYWERRRVYELGGPASDGVSPFLFLKNLVEF
jgi:hypothetical protein